MIINIFVGQFCPTRDKNHTNFCISKQEGDQQFSLNSPLFIVHNIMRQMQTYYYKQMYSIPKLGKLARKSKKGLSSILGTVIVLAITIALGALLYAYANGMFGNLTQNVNVAAQAQLIVNPSTGGAYLQYSLTNNGNIKVNITSISINGKSVTAGISLNPGETYQNVVTLTGNFTPGTYYTVIFQGQTSTGKAFSIAENVLASETA